MDVSTQGNPHGIDECPGSKYMEYPTAYNFMRLIIEEDMYYIYMVIAACVMFAIVTAMFLKVFIDVWKLKDEQIRHDVTICVILPFVISAFSLIGMFFPRSNPAMYTLCLTYMMFAYWRCFNLFIRLYGDCQHMSDIFYRSNIRLKTNNAPFCCFICLPTIAPSMCHINLYKWLVLHTCLVRIILQAAIDVIRTEGLCDHTPETKLMMYVDLISTFVALYGCMGFVKSSVELIGKYQVENLFRIVNITQGIFGLQRFILERMSFDDAIFPDMYFDLVEDKMHTLEVLEARVQADFWYNVLMIFWLIPISILILITIRPGKCALFDMPPVPMAHIDTHGDFPKYNGSYVPSFRNSIVDVEIALNGGLTEEDRKRTATALSQNSLMVPGTKF